MLTLTADNLPQTVIFEGDMSVEKSEALRNLATELLYARRRNTEDTESLTRTLIAEGRHPDLVEFSGESVLIGSEKDAPPGTVRHLLKRVLPYSPWRAHARVIIFHNAAGIKDEAETALLKTLEEPAENNYFFLSVPTADALKETIRSRSVITRIAGKIPPTELPQDPWYRFYVLAGADEFIAQFPEAAENLITTAKQQCDELAFTGADFPLLEKLLFLSPKQLFEKDTILVQSRALKFALLPFYAALRDRVVQGTTPSFSPLALPRLAVPAAIRAAGLMQTYMHNLETRVFGNRPLNQVTVFYSFFFRFMQIWAERQEVVGPAATRMS